MRISHSVKLALVAIFCALTGDGVDSRVVPRSTNSCKPLIRQDILKLTDTQRNAFFNALRKLNTGPQPNKYDWYANKHVEYQRVAHGTAWFLPWHRMFLRRLEKQLQEIDPTVTIPYWDWSVASQTLKSHSVFSSEWCGGNGRASDKCVVDGKFADWKPYYGNKKCIQRAFDEESMQAVYSAEKMRELLRKNKDFASFNEELEMPAHSIIHVAIDGDMSTSGSPADPLFFIHHSFVDLQWATWQSMNKENAMAFGGKKRDGTNAQLTDKLTPFDVTVRDVMDTRDLCYVYDRLAGNNKLSKRRITRRQQQQQQQRPSLLQGILSSVNSVVKQVASEITHEFSDYTVDLSDTKPSAAFVNEVLGRTKRRDTAEIKNDDPVYVNGLRTSKPIPSEKIRQVGYDEASIRESEEKTRELLMQFNSLPGYVSPSDLINHPNALADAAKDRKQVSVMRGVYETPVDVPRTSDNRVDVDKLTTSIKNTLAALDVIIAQKLTVPNKS